MAIISWLLVGIFVGFVTAEILPHTTQFGMKAHVIIGIIGAVLGGWMVGMLNHENVLVVSLRDIASAATGALVLLALSRLLSGSPTKSSRV